MWREWLTRCGAAAVVPRAAVGPLLASRPELGSADPDLADTDRSVVLTCAHGYSSSLAAATLLDLGYSRATDVIGGFEAWAADGLPVVFGDD